MNLPFTLPAWMPGWVTIVILVPAILFLLAFVLMPFSVFGVKGRLEGVEARLDEIQGEIRSLSLRLPEPVSARMSEYDAPPLAPDGYQDDSLPSRPPIPPAPRVATATRGAPRGTPGGAMGGDGRAPPPDAPPRWADPPGRAEPRFDRPR